MDASVFAKMLSGPGQLDLKKMGYKYGQENLQEFLALRKQYFYQELPLHDFDRNSMVYLGTRRYKFRCQRLMFC